MIGLTCWGCGWEGRAPDRYAGLRVTCKRCRTVNVVPDAVTEELFVRDWIDAIAGGWAGALAESPTAEVPAYTDLHGAT